MTTTTERSPRATTTERSPRATSPPSATGAFAALGHRFRVETNAPALTAQLAEALRPLAAPGGGADHRYEVVVDDAGKTTVAADGAALVRGASLPLALEWLLWHVNQSAALSVAGQVTLHAGAVQAGSTGILLPGPSGAGKSSLVAALVERGLGYLSDELVVLEESGDTMVGLRKPLALRPGAQPSLPRWRPRHAFTAGGGSTWLADPDQVVPAGTPAPCHPAFVICPRYTGGTSASLTALTAPHGLVELLGNSVRIGTPDPAHVARLAGLARRCRCFRLEFGSLDEAAGLVVDLVSAS